MSRIGKQIMEIPKGVECTVSGSTVTVKGPKGTLTHHMPETVKVVVEGTQARVVISDENDRLQRMMWGTHASILSNMLAGVVNGYSKQLEINGVGYKVAQSGQKLTFQVGYTHPVVYEVPKSITVAVDKNIITVSGADKQLVGQVAAEIRAIRKPEPYKGKGIKYTDEVIRRKAGKAATAAA